MSAATQSTEPVARGVFVVFEGGEGAGKSTQAHLLADHLSLAGREVLMTREPGGTPVAEAIRSLLLDLRHAGLDARAEALLFAAARAAHVKDLIRPALDRGAIVVCDRFADSSLAYQGVARGLGVEVVADLSTWAAAGLVPDMTVLLDVDPKLGLGRAEREGSFDRMETESAGFHHEVRQAFLDLSQRDQDRYLVLEANRPIPELAHVIATAIDRLITHLAGSE